MSIQASFRENLYKLCWRHFLGKQLVFVKDSLTLFYHSIDRVNSWEYRFDCHRRLILIISIIIFLVKARFQRFASHRHSKPVSVCCWYVSQLSFKSSDPRSLFNCTLSATFCGVFDSNLHEGWLVPCLGLSFPSGYAEACQPSYTFNCWLILASVGYTVLFLLLKIRKLNES